MPQDPVTTSSVNLMAPIRISASAIEHVVGLIRSAKVFRDERRS